MHPFARPRLVVSRCLELDACRYNALTISAPIVPRLAHFVELVDVCPEVGIGLGVPRDPVRIVESGHGLRLVQPASGRDLTETMARFAEDWLGERPDLDGFLLKNRSPSCGIADVKIWCAAENAPPAGKGAGMFAAAVLARFPHAAIEDEGRLTNFALRHHFLTKLFALADLREVEQSGGAVALVEFQARYKLLLMAYSQQGLGRLVANAERRGFAEVVARYREELARALARPARVGSHVNALMHALGYVSDELSAPETAEFLDALGEYRRRRLPLAAPLAVMRNWVARFDPPYLCRQRYLEPYPRELLDLGDSARGTGDA